MESCDVLIVGGGPAGSSCARRLRDAGLDVVLIDKAEFPRDKVCAGWITPAVVKELDLDLNDYARQHVLQPITGFRTSSWSGPEVSTRFDAPVSYGIRRCEFDHYLLSHCEAQLYLGEPLRTLAPAIGGWVINDRWKAPFVIGAGGHFCPVARFAADVPKGGDSSVLAQEIEFELSVDQLHQCSIEGDTPELFFCQDLKGYGWCFRKGNYLNVGLGRENERSLSACVADFCDFLKAQKKLPADAPAKFHGHAYRLYQYPPRTSRYDSVLLIGDSAGLAYAESGEGIRPAIESGLMAAAAIIESRRSGRSDALQRLQLQLTARFGRRRPLSVINLLPAALKRGLAAQLLKSRWFTRHVLIERWFLHRHQPPLSSVSLTVPRREIPA